MPRLFLNDALLLGLNRSTKNVSLDSRLLSPLTWIVIVFVVWPGAKVIVPVPAGGYVVSGSAVLLDGYPPGTPYTVEFNASPVWIAFRRAGGLSHSRPFGDGVALPKRYRAMQLDIWARARNNGAFHQSASPQGLLP